jgi:hypothetical protein
MGSIYDSDLDAREADQEVIKAANGLESKKVPDRISLSLPLDCKQKYLQYCKEHYISPSAQLRAWIDAYCTD